MSPEDLALLHPKLFHVTSQGAAAQIRRNGLLTSSDLLDRLGIAEDKRLRLPTSRRPKSVSFAETELGRVTINDNRPLSEKKLQAVLDDGLTTADWLLMLNSRVFFFTKVDGLISLTRSKANRGVPKDILVIDTHKLALAYGARMEIVPINSGNTNHQPTRRGIATFAPLLDTDYAHWRRRCGKKAPDRIKEVAVLGSIVDIENFISDVQEGVLHD